jgi:hypothetical protein
MALALFVAALVAVHVLRRVPEVVAAVGEPMGVELAARMFPAAAATRLAREGGWTVVLDAEGRRLGAVASTSPEMDGVVGYAGPVPVLIGVDAAGRTVEPVLLENRETPGFVRRVERAGFLGNWTGLAVAQAAEREVDAVSMATMTSSAIARSIRGRLEQLDGLPVDDGRAPGAGVGSLTFGGLDAAIMALVLAAVLVSMRAGFLANPRVFRVARVGVLVASVALLGVVGATMVSMALVEGWAVAGRIHGGAGMVLLAAVALGFPLWTGRNVYCQGLCPFGAAQELLWKLSPRKRHVPYPMSRRLRWIRYGLLVAVVGSMMAGRGLATDWQEPFSAFRWQAAGWPALALAGLAWLASGLGFHRPWCAYFCSSGALLDAIRKPPTPERKTP